MGVEPACMSEHHMCVVPKEARRESQMPRDWGYRQLLVILHVGTEQTQTQVLWNSS